MKTRHTFRFYPNERQQRQLAKDFGCARYAYNYILRLRTDSFNGGTPMNYSSSSAAWTKHRQDPEVSWLRDSSSVPQQQALRHLQTAFTNFYAKRARYPTFHNKHGRQTAEHTRNSFKWDARNRNLKVANLGRLDIHWSRCFESSPTTVTIIKDSAGRYFVSLCLDEVIKELPKTGQSVGIDLGINRLATFSNGEHIANPQHTAKNATKLKKLQRVMARRVKGSNRRTVARSKVARLHAHIANARKDRLDKLSIDLVRRFDVIAIEDLDVRGMMQKAHIAKHIADVSFGQFRQMIEYKAAWYGKEVRHANRWFPSSKRCFNCGFVNQVMPTTREFKCTQCGDKCDRDENAAKNILKFAEVIPQATAGKSGSYGRGEYVKPHTTLVVCGGAQGSVNQPSSVDAGHALPS